MLFKIGNHCLRKLNLKMNGTKWEFHIFWKIKTNNNQWIDFISCGRCHRLVQKCSVSFASTKKEMKTRADGVRQSVVYFDFEWIQRKILLCLVFVFFSFQNCSAFIPSYGVCFSWVNWLRMNIVRALFYITLACVRWHLQ